MTVTPSGLNIGNVTPGVGGITGNFKAYGSFIHPTETREITTLVTWSSSTTDVATVDNTGKITVTGRACGQAIITATANSDLVGSGDSKAIMTGTATVDVKFTTGNCP